MRVEVNRYQNTQLTKEEHSEIWIRYENRHPAAERAREEGEKLRDEVRRMEILAKKFYTFFSFLILIITL